jgi:hypothetical protein
MGRPIGSANKQRPFNEALQVALRSRPLALRRIADRLLDAAEKGDLAYIRELADRLDGKSPQMVDHGDAPITQLSDSQLYEIAGRGCGYYDASPKALAPPRRP